MLRHNGLRNDYNHCLTAVYVVSEFCRCLAGISQTVQ